MESHRAEADHYIADESHYEDGRMRVPEAVPYAFYTEIDKDEIGERIDCLSAVRRDVVVLRWSLR